MNHSDSFFKVNIPLMITGGVFTGAVAYWIGGTFEKGITIEKWFENLNYILHHPFKNYWNEYTWIAMLGAFTIYALIILYWGTFNRIYMSGKEFGTSKWAQTEALDRKLADRSKNIHDPLNIVILEEKKKK